ncbi:AraC family transcriptional regulator [Pseudomonas akapageensis]|uniref:AraC family transcriptional regulator n=1 Tax=Pseudomonas akapageensis TaxID=2609961 RepID=UPI0014083728|nr:AraC family transcriptional regulator [Pseudomonas akapageensis]
MSAHPLSPISLSLRSYAGECAPHDHDFQQIVLPQSGVMEIEVEGRGGRVDWSQGVVIASGARHTFSTPTANSFIVLDIAPHAAQALGDKPYFAITPPIRHLLDYASHNAHALMNTPALADSWSTLLFSSFAPPTKPSESRHQVILARALAYIEQNLHAPMTVADIARTCATSERRLYQLFEQQLQRSPFAYITEQRLNRAVDLLRGTTRSIADIAQCVGYADQSALTHALKKSRNVTPASLRKAALAQE